jgi:hypothetical protein
MNESDFEKLMEHTDQELKDQGVPIPSRPLHAFSEVSRRLNIAIVISPEAAPAIPRRYDRFTLAAHINRWYQARYGDSLKVHLGPGSVAVMIRGDPWKMVIPRIYGSVICICDPDLDKYRNSPRIAAGPQPPEYNVLLCIEKFPAGLTGILTDMERQEILQFFMKAHEALQSLERICSKPYVNEAIADLNSAVTFILQRPPQYGQSKWSSLQLVEKLLKSFLKMNKASIPKHHELRRILKSAQNYGLVAPDAALLASIQCPAGVRYGEVPVKREEAISAHHASLDVVNQLAGLIIGI